MLIHWGLPTLCRKRTWKESPKSPQWHSPFAIVQVSMTGQCGFDSHGYSHHYKLKKVFSSMNGMEEIAGNDHS